MKRAAWLSACTKYRFDLHRAWNANECSDLGVLWVGANPSKADADVDDHTVRKEVEFTARLGFATYHKVNLCPWRGTDPKSVPRALPDDEAWRANALAVNQAAENSALVVAAWGDCLAWHPVFKQWVDRMMILLRASGRPIRCLGTTARGNPKHPLMLPYSTDLQEFK